MNIEDPTPLLGNLSPREFMRDIWQRQPLLIRQAIPGFEPTITLADIKALARREEAESRLIWHNDKGWKMKAGPFPRLSLPRQAAWTLLVQSVDLHDDAIAALMRRFRFIADARLDDAMISIANDGGGVGPHYDSYDVFLLQAHGQRRWRISTQTDLSLEPGLPLKILSNFEAEHEYLLNPGDMLYLPPHICHDGVAVGDCMTISIGFRVPSQAALARGMLEAAADQISAQYWGEPGLYGEPALPGADLSSLYTDAGTDATATPAALPEQLVQATLETLKKVRLDQAVAARFLGQWLSNRPENAWFEPMQNPPTLAQTLPETGRLVLDRCTRLMYFEDQLFINGELAPVINDSVLRQLADERELTYHAMQSLGMAARTMLDEWLDEGWLHYEA
ncbi:cupin domain-containing protein [Alcaligenaceae bacterium CGII-47]|nr:cupin domain-containing protein [Alcaligenaceae bacterium CGII-47]